MLIETLGANCLGNMLAGKRVSTAGYGNKNEEGSVRAGYGNKMDF